MRRFHNYDEAVAHIHRLRQKRKRSNEVYTLVYFLPAPVEILDCRPVSSMDDIEEFEREIDEANRQHQQAIAERKNALNAEYPDLELIAQHAGRRSAISLSLLLKSIRENGMDTTKESAERTAFYRGVKELRRLGLIP
jgi:hypothetical protein